MGHPIDSKGLYPTQTKIKTVRDALTPQNILELKSFMGLVMYYSRFLPNLSRNVVTFFFIAEICPMEID